MTFELPDFKLGGVLLTGRQIRLQFSAHNGFEANALPASEFGIAPASL
jgi:hypothetical protein